MATNVRIDPFRSYNFLVEIEGIEPMGFMEVSGLTAEGDPIEYREGSDVPLHVRKLVGLRKYGNITLKRGYVQDASFWTWFANIANGQPDRRNGTVVLLSESREEVMRWNFENAWVNKVEGPALKATSNEVAIESLELCLEAVTFEL